MVLNPSLGLDGATGRPSVVDRSGPIDPECERRQELTSRADRSRRHDGLPHGHADNGRGDVLAAQGVPARPASSRDDPRWERPLPWVGPVEPYADPLVQVTVAATLINVCIPVAILWLATRRRFWSVRLLLALPVVVAILLTGYSTLSSLILDRPQMTVPPWWGVFLGVVLLAMVGVPIVAYATAFVLSLVRVRWLKWLLALPVVAAILVAGSSALIFLIPENRQSAESSWWSIPLDVTMLSMSGLPIVAYAAVLVLSLVRRRWRKTGRLHRERLARGHSDWGDHASV